VYKWILINAKQQTGKTGQKRAERNPLRRQKSQLAYSAIYKEEEEEVIQLY
jgi:hypothetical protein